MGKVKVIRSCEKQVVQKNRAATITERFFRSLTLAAQMKRIMFFCGSSSLSGESLALFFDEITLFFDSLDIFAGSGIDTDEFALFDKVGYNDFRARIDGCGFRQVRRRVAPHAWFGVSNL